MNASQEEIIEALNKTNVWSLINILPDKLDSRIDEFAQEITPL